MVEDAGRRIIEAVTAWPGVSVGRGERGETSIRYGNRELGHLHGDRVLHAAFPVAVWHELHDDGRIGYHPVFPGKPGYAARGIDGESDIADVVALLRINYERRARTRAGESLPGRES